MSREETPLISPRLVLEQVAGAIPEDCRENIIIIGRIAAGYYFFGDAPNLQVHTKDVDCLLSPRIGAIGAGRAVADRLFANQWQLREQGPWVKPGDSGTPVDELPIVRLYPPGSTEWFIELLIVPEFGDDRGRRYIRLETSQGHFSLCSFGFLSLAEYQPIVTPFGVAIALPEMMALSNLLHHPVIGPETMSGQIGGRDIKRSNKDLGRVLAIAYLSEAYREDALLDWPRLWEEALRNRFPSKWRELALRAGSGIRQLLLAVNEPDLEEAHHSCVSGLLVSRRPDLRQLRAIGERLIQDAIAGLEELGQ